LCVAVHTQTHTDTKQDACIPRTDTLGHKTFYCMSMTANKD
jgi:hypothetical protein